MKPRKKPGQAKTTHRQLIVVGYAWYKDDQWDRVREVCPDSDGFADTYRNGWDFAQERFQQLGKEVQQRGMKLVKVPLDVEELLEWCRSHRLQPNGQARSQFVAEKAAKMK